MPPFSLLIIPTTNPTTTTASQLIRTAANPSIIANHPFPKKVISFISTLPDTVDAYVFDIATEQVVSSIFIATNIHTHSLFQSDSNIIQKSISWKLAAKNLGLHTSEIIVILHPCDATIAIQLALDSEGIKLHLCNDISMVRLTLDEITLGRLARRTIVPDEQDINEEIFQTLQRICGSSEQTKQLLRQHKCIASVCEQYVNSTSTNNTNNPSINSSVESTVQKFFTTIL
jgi:hypothetical protein